MVAAILVFVVALPILLTAAQSDSQSRPTVSISGAIRTPGRYKFDQGLTVGQLIAMAGGLTPKGKMSGIVLYRKRDGASEPKKVKAKVTTALQADDLVEVPQN